MHNVTAHYHHSFMLLCRLIVASDNTQTTHKCSNAATVKEEEDCELTNMDVKIMYNLKY